MSKDAPKEKHALKEKDILCLGHLQRVYALLGSLHDVGTERDTAGNRTLYFDDYVKLVLLHTWNPLLGSIRDLQRAAALPKVAKALGIKRFSAGSFSESPRVFAPEMLQPIVAELVGQLEPGSVDPRLKEFKHALTLVDGSVVVGLQRMAQSAMGLDARYTTKRDGRGVYGSRLHLQLDLKTFSAHRIDRTGARNAGANREANVLRRNLEPNRCYVGDGHYGEKGVFKDIADAGSSYVMRMAENAVFDPTAADRPLSQEAQDAGIVRDAVAEFPGIGQVRRVEVRVTPHPRRTRSGVKHTDLIILYTNLIDLPPELVALIYRYRYTVELFFRILKQLLGLRHLLSQRQEGIDIQISCALIVCVLIQLISGKKPNKAMRNMINWYLLGLADAPDVINFLNEPDNTGVKLRAKAELWKKLLS
jgi:hypothetical protein